ncbi:MAG: hypothetical protein ACJAYY_001681 [Paraglaciecola sp.]|jgi:hypothetical protein
MNLKLIIKKDKSEQIRSLALRGHERNNLYPIFF